MVNANKLQSKIVDNLHGTSYHTKASFEAARLVRSKRMSDEEVYALTKLSRSVENPVRFRIHSILQAAVKVHGAMHWPLTGRPLAVLPPSQSSFFREGELWLKSLVCDFKCLFPSFHLPKSNLREVPHQSIKKLLYNF